MKHKNIVIGLAFAALFFAILLPPEAYPDGRLAVILCATFAFFISLNERRIHPAYLHGGLALFAPVPEPASMTLIGIGIVAFATRSRRRV